MKMKINKGFTPSLENGTVFSKRGKAVVPFFSAGFTLMELLMVICIMAIILALSFPFFSSLIKKESLEKDVAGLTSFIRNARLLAVSSKNAAAFGVHLESGRAVLFEGASYVPGGPNEKVIVFSDKVYMSSYALNLGTEDIVFSRLIGSTLNFGTITLSLKDDSVSTTITILKTGVVQ